MKGSLLAAFLVSSALAVALSAQTKPADTTKPPDAKPAAPAAQTTAPKEHSMTGCLQKGTEAGTWVVTNTDPKGPKMIGIVTSKDKLDAHVGHKIEITGTAVPNKEAESMATKPAKADHYMNLTAVKMVAATCP